MSVTKFQHISPRLYLFVATVLFSHVASYSNTSSVEAPSLTRSAGQSSMAVSRSNEFVLALSPEGDSSMKVMAASSAGQQSSVDAVGGPSLSQTPSSVAPSSLTPSINVGSSSVTSQIVAPSLSYVLFTSISNSHIGLTAGTIYIQPSLSTAAVGGEATSTAPSSQTTFTQSRVLFTSPSAAHSRLNSGVYTSGQLTTIAPSKAGSANVQPSSSIIYNEMTCYKCSYNCKTGYCKKEKEKCVGNAVHCLDFHFNYMNNSQLIGKACSTPEYCGKEEEACQKQNKTHGYAIEECSIKCCKSNLCNDNFSDKTSSLVSPSASASVQPTTIAPTKTGSYEYIIATEEDGGLWIDRFAKIKIRGVYRETKLLLSDSSHMVYSHDV